MKKETTQSSNCLSSVWCSPDTSPRHQPRVWAGIETNSQIDFQPTWLYTTQSTVRSSALPESWYYVCSPNTRTRARVSGTFFPLRFSRDQNKDEMAPRLLNRGWRYRIAVLTAAERERDWIIKQDRESESHKTDMRTVRIEKSQKGFVYKINK